MGRGLFSIGRGVISGLYGIVEQPYKQIKKEGAVGIFKGTAKGLAGLVAKPVGGVFGAIEKTAEGVKNTFNYLDGNASKEQAPNQTRERAPKTFGERRGDSIGQLYSRESLRENDFLVSERQQYCAVFEQGGILTLYASNTPERATR